MNPIKSRKAITFNKAPTFGESPKVFAHDNSKWVPYLWSDILKMTVKDLMDLKLRFMVEFVYLEDFGKDPRKIRVCSHKEDTDKVAAKYPNDYTVNLMSVLRIFQNDLTGNDGQEVEKLFFCVSELGAKVV